MLQNGISTADIAERRRAKRPLTKRQAQYLLCLERGDLDSCAYCGAELNDANRTIDHRRSRLRGGSNDISNLCLSCVECNNKKSHLPEDVFRRLLVEGFPTEKPQRKQLYAPPAKSVKLTVEKPRTQHEVADLIPPETRAALHRLSNAAASRAATCTKCAFLLRTDPDARCLDHQLSLGVRPYPWPARSDVRKNGRGYPDP